MDSLRTELLTWKTLNFPIGSVDILSRAVFTEKRGNFNVLGWENQISQSALQKVKRSDFFIMKAKGQFSKTQYKARIDIKIEELISVHKKNSFTHHKQIIKI